MYLLQFLFYICLYTSLTFGSKVSLAGMIENILLTFDFDPYFSQMPLKNIDCINDSQIYFLNPTYALLPSANIYAQCHCVADSGTMQLASAHASDMLCAHLIDPKKCMIGVLWT